MSTDPLPDSTLAELRRLHEAATPGPWLLTKDDQQVYVLEHNGWWKGEETFRNRFSFWMQGHHAQKADHFSLGLPATPDEELAANSRLIVTVRTALPDLLTELSSARLRLAEQSALLSACGDLATAAQAVLDDMQVDLDGIGEQAATWESAHALLAALTVVEERLKP